VSGPHGAAQRASPLVKAFTIFRGALYSAGFVWLWTWLALSARRLDADIPMTLPIWLRPIGYGLAAAGALLAGACIATFVTRGRGTPAPFDPPREFVASGPYRYVRNPMYVGAATVILGAGLILSSPAIVALAVVFVLTMHLFVVLHVEPALANRFGDAYDRYRSSVHRWIIWKPEASATSRSSD
jgi:protein-S-isoprenylcysteine O-methyltransferase Ste14